MKTVRRKTMKVAETHPQMRVTVKNRMTRMTTNSKYPIDPRARSLQRRIARKARIQIDPNLLTKAPAEVTALKKEIMYTTFYRE